MCPEPAQIELSPCPSQDLIANIRALCYSDIWWPWGNQTAVEWLSLDSEEMILLYIKKLPVTTGGTALPQEASFPPVTLSALNAPHPVNAFSAAPASWVGGNELTLSDPCHLPAIGHIRSGLAWILVLNG